MRGLAVQAKGWLNVGARDPIWSVLILTMLWVWLFRWVEVSWNDVFHSPSIWVELCLFFFLSKVVDLRSSVVSSYWRDYLISILFIVAWIWFFILRRSVGVVIMDSLSFFKTLIAHQRVFLILNFRLVLLISRRLIPTVVLIVLLLIVFKEHIVLVHLVRLSDVANIDWCCLKLTVANGILLSTQNFFKWCSILNPHHFLLLFNLELWRCHHHVTCTIGETREIIFAGNVTIFRFTIRSDTSERAWLVDRRHIWGF